MGLIRKIDLLQGAGGSVTAELTSVEVSYSIEQCSGIVDALATAAQPGDPLPSPFLSQFDFANTPICTSSRAGAIWPDTACVNVICTFTFNNGYLTTTGALKSQQFSYDKNGILVVVAYTDPGGGKQDGYTATFNRKTETGIYTATRYENYDAYDMWGENLTNVNSAIFLGSPIGTVQFLSADGTEVAPGWFNNRYVFEYDPDGFNPLILYFNRFGRVPSPAPGPFPGLNGGNGPPFAPGGGNGWVVPDNYDQFDFTLDFNWIESLAGY